MKILIATAALLLTVPPLARAGNADDSSVLGQFYLFTAPIVSNTRHYYTAQGTTACYGVVFEPQTCTFTAVGGTNTGLGGEILSRKGIGVGVELSYAGPNWNFDSSGLGVGSVDASYHFFGNKSRKGLDPFATGGYSLYYGQRTAFQSGFNLGGGLNLWLIKHAALRLEARYQGGINYFNSNLTRYVAFRFGMTFR
jgi:hypothetical protein